VQSWTTRVEFMDYLPFLIAANGCICGVCDNDHLNYAGGDRPRPPHATTFDRLQFNVIAALPGRQRNVEGDSLIGLEA